MNENKWKLPNNQPGRLEFKSEAIHVWVTHFISTENEAYGRIYSPPAKIEDLKEQPFSLEFDVEDTNGRLKLIDCFTTTVETIGNKTIVHFVAKRVKTLWRGYQTEVIPEPDSDIFPEPDLKIKGTHKKEALKSSLRRKGRVGRVLSVIEQKRK